MSVSALSGEDIARKGLVNNTDYLTSIPNVNAVDLGPTFGQQLVIRGMATAYFGPPTTVSYLGELPISSPVATYATDIKLVDLERVEVLRGPQGTLFGASSLGGVVRNIPVAPKLDQMEGKLDIGTSAVAHSDDLSNKIVGVVNLPLVEDTLALRVAAYRYDNAGYIDMLVVLRLKA